MQGFLNLFLVAMGVGGFSLSFYIFKSKKKQKPIACPLDGDCDAVVHSDYSRFFGAPVEFLGLLYYAAVSLNYFFFFFYREMMNPFLTLLLLVFSFLALLFSGYLTFIQAFNLKHWCTWCLVSAFLCVAIFAFSFLNSGFGFLPLLIENKDAFLALHLLGVSLGLGTAVLSDALFFKFLKDFQISKFEADTLKFLSQGMWLALGVIIITGLGLYLPHAGHLRENPVFLVKMIIVAVIVLNGAFLNLLIMPRLVKAAAENNPAGGGPAYDYHESDLPILGKLPFVLGAISSVSWAMAFLAGMFLDKIETLGFNKTAFIYGAAVFAAVAVGLTMEKLLKRQVGRI